MEVPLPASTTKHLSTLYHRLPRSHISLSLRQQSSTPSSTSFTSTGTTGTTLWLGSQVLAAYLVSTLTPHKFLPLPLANDNESETCTHRRPRAIELGSGVGYLTLTLASLGYNVVSTDIQPVLDTVLRPNIDSGCRLLRSEFGASSIGDVNVVEFDWVKVAANERGIEEVKGGFDIIVTTDTFYAPHLVDPLWETLARLCREDGESTSTTTTTSNTRCVLIALERRDARLIDHALKRGVQAGFELCKVAHSRVSRSIAQTGWGWQATDWEGVEIWKAKWKSLP